MNERTDERTDGVTLSHLELLIAAKNANINANVSWNLTLTNNNIFLIILPSFMTKISQSKPPSVNPGNCLHQNSNTRLQENTLNKKTSALLNYNQKFGLLFINYFCKKSIKFITEIRCLDPSRVFEAEVEAWIMFIVDPVIGTDIRWRIHNRGENYS